MSLRTTKFFFGTLGLRTVGKHYLAIQAIGKDKSGLVAGITGVVCEDFDCNIEGSAMSIVGGHFAATLIASSSEAIDDFALREAIGKTGDDLAIHVSPLAESDVRRAWRDASHELTVETAERPGLVHEISRLLSEQAVNITFLASSCDPRRNRSTVMIAGTLPERMSSNQLKTVIEENVTGGPLVDVKPVQTVT
jgi:glycine cleavage system regulatory protein